MTNYLFLDIETPNRQNNRICSIGLVLNSTTGEHIFEEHYYVNPQQGFDELNIGIHGIAPAHVKDAPIFPVLWDEMLSSLFQDTIIVAHNASFDLGVLGKTLDSYSIPKPAISYIDTLVVAKHFLDLPDYQLPTISQELNVELPSHHDALADAMACCGIFWKLASNISALDSYADSWYWKDFDPATQKCASCDSILTDLYGIALGISADRLLYADEVEG